MTDADRVNVVPVERHAGFASSGLVSGAVVVGDEFSGHVQGVDADVVARGCGVLGL